MACSAGSLSQLLRLAVSFLLIARISVSLHLCVQRLQEMRSSENERTRKDRDKREKRRQEKEMARLHEQ